MHGVWLIPTMSSAETLLETRSMQPRTEHLICDLHVDGLGTSTPALLSGLQ